MKSIYQSTSPRIERTEFATWEDFLALLPRIDRSDGVPLLLRGSTFQSFSSFRWVLDKVVQDELNPYPVVYRLPVKVLFPLRATTCTGTPTWQDREFNRFESHVDTFESRKGQCWRTDLPPALIRALFLDGVIIPVEHYAYVAMSGPGKIAFTESAVKGEADRQLVMKFGKYLKRFFPHLSVPKIAKLSAMFRGATQELEVKFARTEEEVLRVYLDGPESCMSQDHDEYSSLLDGSHPVEVYGDSPNLAVAYTERDGRITARTVVQTDTKEWAMVYGDRTILELALSELGYKEGSLLGGKMRVVPVGDDYVMPCLDGRDMHVIREGSWFVVSTSGDEAQKTNGTLYGGEGTCCIHCGFDLDDLTEVNGDDVCEECLSQNYYYAYTGRHREYVLDSDDVYEWYGSRYTESGMQYHGLVVETRTCDVMLLDDSVSTESGELVHKDHAKAFWFEGEEYYVHEEDWSQPDYTKDVVSGLVVRIADAQWTADGWTTEGEYLDVEVG